MNQLKARQLSKNRLEGRARTRGMRGGSIAGLWSHLGLSIDLLTTRPALRFTVVKKNSRQKTQLWRSLLTCCWIQRETDPQPKHQTSAQRILVVLLPAFSFEEAKNNVLLFYPWNCQLATGVTMQRVCMG